MNKLNNDLALRLFSSMLRIREAEEEIARRYSEWEMRCPTHLSIGQEAVAAAVGLVLNKDDYAVSSHRSHAHYLGKGGNLDKMIAELYGKESGCSGGRGGSMHLIDESVGFKGSSAIIGNTIPIGVGIGLSIQLNKSSQVSCVYFGDAAIEEGVFYEAINFAAVRSLPILFICENNLYSVYSPLSVRQPKSRKIHEMVKAIGIDSTSGDGNNASEIYQTISTLVDNIRQTGKPQFVEFATYRWREHCGQNYDNDIGYRTLDEFGEWKRKDPLVLHEKELINNYFVSQDLIQTMKSNVIDEIRHAFDLARQSDYPDKTTIFNHVYK